MWRDFKTSKVFQELFIVAEKCSRLQKISRKLSRFTFLKINDFIIFIFLCKFSGSGEWRTRAAKLFQLWFFCELTFRLYCFAKKFKGLFNFIHINFHILHIFHVIKNAAYIKLFPPCFHIRFSSLPSRKLFIFTF